MFEPLKDVREFAKLRADEEMQTLAWENGADLAPEFFYELIKNSKLAAAEYKMDHAAYDRKCS